MAVTQRQAVVLFGDVVHSRRDPAASSAWLRRLVGELDDAYRGVRLAPFGFTQGDELQGLLEPSADPFQAVILAALLDGARPVRWSIAAGSVEPGRGPATERTGEAFLRARQAIGRARVQRDALVVETGDDRADGLLADLAPVLAELLAGLTDRQREVARLLLVDRLRQAEVADRLRIRRATVSVIAARARLRSIERLADAARSLFREGVATLGDGDPVAS